MRAGPCEFGGAPVFCKTRYWRVFACDKALAADAGRHADLMDRIRAMGNPPVEVSARRAHQRSPYEDLEKKSANRVLSALADASIVIRPAGRSSWALADPLFAAYTRREIHAS